MEGREEPPKMLKDQREKVSEYPRSERVLRLEPVEIPCGMRRTCCHYSAALQLKRGLQIGFCPRAKLHESFAQFRVATWSGPTVYSVRRRGGLVMS